MLGAPRYNNRARGGLGAGSGRRADLPGGPKSGIAQNCQSPTAVRQFHSRCECTAQQGKTNFESIPSQSKTYIFYLHSPHCVDVPWLVCRYKISAHAPDQAEKKQILRLMGD